MDAPHSPVAIDGSSLDLRAVAEVARAGRPTALTPAARAAMARSADWVRRASHGEIRDATGAELPIYGVNTGFGSLARVRIPLERTRDLSWNLMRSHAAGTGPALPHEAVRAMMLLRANALAKGFSGCRPALVETLLAMLDRGVIPEVPSRGSCGSSGDLAPLSHLALVVFAGSDDPAESGIAWFGGERLTGAEAMARAGLARLIPGAKDGLAMTNGAQLTAGLGALAAWDAGHLVVHAEIAAALSWEAMRGVTRALHPDVHALRPFPGAIRCAAHLRALLAGSSLVDSQEGKVQDAYSLRCTPSVLGAVRDGVVYAARQVAVEINAVTDNPVILPDADSDNKAFSAGLFHGEPVGLALDHLKLALCELGSLAERRVYRLTTGSLSARLPVFVSSPGERPSLALMTAQTTAAALVAENRQLAWPCSADSIPTCEDQEDHVAMSTTAARRATVVLRNAERIIAIELLAAAKGVRFRVEREGGRCSPATQAALDVLAPALAAGETPDVQLAALVGVLRGDTLLRAVEAVAGPLEVPGA